ncbi:MAG: hypothetical protein BroJett022_20600 [Actinomycetes bacterium]|nr:MAG: hypothetical protein BroJett022_20600 [Actinomycetes bacterium]
MPTTLPTAGEASSARSAATPMSPVGPVTATLSPDPLMGSGDPDGPRDRRAAPPLDRDRGGSRGDGSPAL